MSLLTPPFRQGGAFFSLLFVAVLASGFSPNLLLACLPYQENSPFCHSTSVQRLFSTRLEAVPGAARSTFVYFVQGAADHFVPQSVSEGGRMRRSDAIEAGKIRKLATQCRDCNVVLLHIQRGGAHWYTAKHPWATYLRVYSRGKKLLSRHVNVLNGADPQSLSTLLKSSERWFPESNLHLIYRGHSIFPSYEPSLPLRSGGETPADSMGSSSGPIGPSNDVQPFDYNFKQSRYGIDTFSQSLSDAGLTHRLASVTFAACSMAYLEVAASLSPWTHQMIAPQVDIVETLVAGFDHSYLTQVRDSMGGDQVGELLSLQLLAPFKRDPMKEDYMMEAPVSLIHLDHFQELAGNFWRLLDQIREVDPHFFETHAREIGKAGAVEKVISERYVNQLRAKGKSEAKIQVILQAVKTNSLNARQVDVTRFLEFVVTQDFPPSIRESARLLMESLHTAVTVLNAPLYSHKSGLSFELPERPGSISENVNRNSDSTETGQVQGYLQPLSSLFRKTKCCCYSC